MLPMLPMLVPEVPGIYTAEDEAGGYDTAWVVSACRGSGVEGFRGGRDVLD